MTVGELMGVFVDEGNLADGLLKLRCSGCTSYGDDLGAEAHMDEVIKAAEAHVTTAHRDQRGLYVPDELRIREVQLTVDARVRRFPRVMISCQCAKWTIGFQALPSTEVTINRLLAITAEHLARQHQYRPEEAQNAAVNDPVSG